MVMTQKFHVKFLTMGKICTISLISFLNLRMVREDEKFHVKFRGGEILFSGLCRCLMRSSLHSELETVETNVVGPLSKISREIFLGANGLSSQNPATV